MYKKAVIDIDNTLWRFCDFLYERLKVINHAVPPPDYWIDPNFWENYFSKEDFLNAINDIHLDQNNDRHSPYPEAKNFLKTLKKRGFYIIIASHRISETRKQTENWLLRHSLKFDELHISFDKTVLFDESCHVVVDDAPFVLEKAIEKGAISTGILLPWNKNFVNNGYRFLKNLDEVLRYIIEAEGERHRPCE